MPEPTRLPPETVALAHDLRALAEPPRLHLLASLATPRTPDEAAFILGSTAEEAKTHLEALATAGLVRRTPGRRGPAPVTEYALTAQRIFAVGEEVTRLAQSQPDEDLSQTRAVMKASRGTGALLKLGPALVVVHGLKAGAVHTLTGAGPWTLGRDAACNIPLDYDPFASSHHAEVRGAPGKHVLVDGRSRNGTFVNFERIPAGGEVALASGDVIGLGKTLLVYRAPTK